MRTHASSACWRLVISRRSGSALPAGLRSVSIQPRASTSASRSGATGATTGSRAATETTGPACRSVASTTRSGAPRCGFRSRSVPPGARSRQPRCRIYHDGTCVAPARRGSRAPSVRGRRPPDPVAELVARARARRRRARRRRPPSSSLPHRPQWLVWDVTPLVRAWHRAVVAEQRAAPEAAGRRRGRSGSSGPYGPSPSSPHVALRPRLVVGYTAPARLARCACRRSPGRVRSPTRPCCSSLLTVAGRVALGGDEARACCGRAVGRAGGRGGAAARSSSCTWRAPSTRPGLYELPDGSRIDDAIAEAGGAKPKAALDLVNLAAPVADGQQVRRPAARKRSRGGAGPGGRRGCRARREGPPQLRDARATRRAPRHRARSRRSRSSTYRAANGAFRSIDELDAVPGIGPARLEQLGRWSGCEPSRGRWISSGGCRRAHLLAAALCAWASRSPSSSARPTPGSPLAAGRGSRVVAAGSRRRPGLSCSSWRSAPRRALVGQRAAGGARRKRARGGDRASCARARRGDGPGAPERVRASAFPFVSCVSVASSSTSVPVSTCRRSGRPLRERCWRSSSTVAAPARPREPRAASTRRATCVGRAFTSSCGERASAWSATAAGWALSRTGCAEVLRARWRRSRPESAGRCLPGSSWARTRGSTQEPARQLPGVGPLPPARRLGPERRLRRRRDDPPRVDPGAPALDRGGRARSAAVFAYVLAVGLAALRRAGGGRRRPRVARLARLAPARPLVLPARRRGRAARVEPVQPARARVPALVRGGRRHLRARSPNRGEARGLSAPGEARRASSRSPPRVALATAPDPLAALRRDPRLLARRQRPRGASRRTAPRPRAGRRGAPSRRCPRPPAPSSGSTAWLAALPRCCARLVGGLPYAQVESRSRASRCSSARRACSSLFVRMRGPLGLAPQPRCAAVMVARSPSPGRACAGRRTGRSRTDCGSPCSTSARATRSCCRSRRAPSSSTRGPPEADVAAPARRARRRTPGSARPHPSPARPHRRRRRRARGARGGRRARPTAPGRERGRAMPPQRPPGRGTCPSSPPARASDCGSGALRVWRCSGRTARALRATIRTTTRSCCSRRYGQVDALLTADAEGNVTVPDSPAARGDPQGRPPRLRGRCRFLRCSSSSTRRSRSSRSDGTTTTVTRRRPRWPPSRASRVSTSIARISTAASRSRPTGERISVSRGALTMLGRSGRGRAPSHLSPHRRRPSEDSTRARAPPRPLRAGVGRDACGRRGERGGGGRGLQLARPLLRQRAAGSCSWRASRAGRRTTRRPSPPTSAILSWARCWCSSRAASSRARPFPRSARRRARSSRTRFPGRATCPPGSGPSSSASASRRTAMPRVRSSRSSGRTRRR